MPDESETERLREAQERHAKDEHEETAHAADAEERHTHERRADKADYLRDKLAEQAAAPDE